MSINLPITRVEFSTEMALAPGVAVQAEGAALVRAAGNQANGVLASTGTDQDKFVGFSIAGTSAAPFAEPFANKVERFIAAGTSYKLGRIPVAGQFQVWNITDQEPETDATLTNDVIGGLTDGVEYEVTYKYALTVFEAVTLAGDVQPGGYSGNSYGQVGVVTRGKIATSEFDASKNWRAATAVKLAPNGQLTDQSGTGVEINAVIEAVPSEDYPQLVIRFDAR